MLAVLTTHPIQYQVPVWKALAAKGTIPFRVFYMSDQGLKARFDPGFSKSFSWDLDLLGGYECEFLDTHRGSRTDSFWALRLKHGFGRALRQAGTEVLWIQGWQVAAYWQAVFAAKRAGIKLWLRGETNARSSVGRTGLQLKRRLLRQLLCRIDRCLYIGEANRQFYMEQGVDHDRLASAPYCVDNARFAAAATAARSERGRIRQEWAIPAEAFCFLFAGKFIAKKRPFDLIEATRRLRYSLQKRKVHLLWVGTGELGDKLRQACHVCVDTERKEHIGVRDANEPAASFIGFLNQSEIARAYAAADCLVLPSDATETWGLVVNEAMASGLPCIVSESCGCAEDLVKPIRRDLCYPAGDIAALQRAMAAVIDDAPSNEVLAAQVAKHDISHTVDTIEDLYAEVTTNRGLTLKDCTQSLRCGARL